jgi:hypothetical protein
LTISFAHHSVTALEAGVRRWINERDVGRRIAGLTAGHPVEVGGADHHRLRRGSLIHRAEAVAYDMAGEVIGGPAGAPESGTPA